MIFFKRQVLKLAVFIFSVHGTAIAQESTTIEIRIPEKPVFIDTMIYGQMLENVNDSMIYKGVTDSMGNERQYIRELLKDLKIPVTRWPGGSIIYEYFWKNGIGPRFLRPVQKKIAWNATENYQFGTDEFLEWCKKIGTAPYINLNMNDHPMYSGTLREALEWIEYVNGSETTPMGKLRAYNGHKDPYKVTYWGIGNENYLPSRTRIQDTDTSYAKRLKLWASVIKERFPDVKLLAVGRFKAWNQTVLDSAGKYIDFLTQHYYVNSRIKNEAIENPNSTLFAPAKMEAHLKILGKTLDSMNAKLQRTHPIKLSIDEWNNRHRVYEDTSYQFKRQSPRRQFDVAVVAGMLNVFIRQSAVVGMANYIFPVNAHGLIRSVGEDDAFLTPLYYLFKEYRDRMQGEVMEAIVKGPGIIAKDAKITISGDCQEVNIDEEQLLFVDVAATRNSANTIHVSVVNRSVDREQDAVIKIPKGYKIKEFWELSYKDINAFNEAGNRYKIVPVTKKAKQAAGKITIKLHPCAVAIIALQPQ